MISSISFTTRGPGFLFLGASLIALAGATPAASAESSSLESTVKALQATVADLSRKLADVEKQLNQQKALPPPTTVARAIIIRRALDDKKEAAARLDAYTVDPTFRGFVRVPNTPVIFKFDAKPRLDLIVDEHNTGARFRFVPALLPLEGSSAYGGGVVSSVGANATQLHLDVRAPGVSDDLRFYYENDFFGSETEPMQYRLAHLYGQYANLTLGFTYGVFEDPDVWPDTVDYEGPNAAIYARRAVAQFKTPITPGTHLTFGVEEPVIFLDNDFDRSATLRTTLPDLAASVRWESETDGHVQASAIVRTIGAKGLITGDQDKLGWGLNLGASLNLGTQNSLQGLLVYGEGIGGMGNDTGFVNSDAAFTSTGKLKPLEYYSAMAGFTHHWNDRWRSTFTYGYAHLENTAGQADDAFHLSHYASANLIWQVGRRVTVGNELLWGRREVRDGGKGDAFRFQLGIAYGLFD